MLDGCSSSRHNTSYGDNVTVDGCKQLPQRKTEGQLESIQASRTPTSM